MQHCTEVEDVQQVIQIQMFNLMFAAVVSQTLEHAMMHVSTQMIELKKSAEIWVTKTAKHIA